MASKRFVDLTGMIVACVLLSPTLSGCRTTPATAIDPYDSPYTPTFRDWMITKLQANGRIIRGSRGYPYELTFRNGEVKGEVVIRVVYNVVPESDVERMSVEMLHDIGRAKSMVRGFLPHMCVETAPGGSGNTGQMIVFPTVELIGEQLEDLKDKYRKEAAEDRASMQKLMKRQAGAWTPNGTSQQTTNEVQRKQ